MIQCPLCLEDVPQFKTNSHIIPKWALVRTKENGRNLSIAHGKVSKNQKDLMTESWCSSPVFERVFGRLLKYEIVQISVSIIVPLNIGVTF